MWLGLHARQAVARSAAAGHWGTAEALAGRSGECNGQGGFFARPLTQAGRRGGWLVHQLDLLLHTIDPAAMPATALERRRPGHDPRMPAYRQLPCSVETATGLLTHAALVSVSKTSRRTRRDRVRLSWPTRPTTLIHSKKET